MLSVGFLQIEAVCCFLRNCCRLLLLQCSNVVLKLVILCSPFHSCGSFEVSEDYHYWPTEFDKMS